ncbi:hypothetical protein Btru_033269 [Bulinus truncatus]|nr:hypothetical protein Btru_033269 [Bulinus truncatus]
MPPPASITVVSEYEDLNVKNLKDKGIPDSNVDSLLFSEFSNNCKPIAVLQKKSIMPSHLNLQKMSNSKDLYDDIKTKNKIPTPYAWSPSLSKSLNPSINITPEKPSNDFKKFFDRDSFESQVLKKIPQPEAWSPGMLLHANPSLLITPEKPLTKKVDHSSPDYKNSLFIMRVVDQKQNVKDKEKAVKNKEKQCVRFDLPSASSEEETLDEFSTPESPITLKGSNIQNSSSPVWKPFSLQKSYNPNDYSDESMLDESTLSMSENYFNDATLIPQNVIASSEIKGIKTDLSNNSQQPLTGSISKSFASYSTVDQCNRTCNSSKLTKVSSDNAIKSTASLGKSDNSNKKKVQPQLQKDKLTLFRSASEPVVSVLREDKNEHISSVYSFPFNSVDRNSEYEHIFARPEFNTTLKIRSELDNMSHQEVDAVKALETALANSESKRTEINEKAASCTNRTSKQFWDLVDIDPSVETLCERVVRMRTSKIPTKTKFVKVDKKIEEKAPDLMEFFTSDLQKETPDLSMPGMTQISPKLAIAPHEKAFDLYCHNRMWLGLSDF